MYPSGDYGTLDRLSDEDVHAHLFGHNSEVSSWAAVANARMQKSTKNLKLAQQSALHEKNEADLVRARIFSLEIEASMLRDRKVKLTRRLARHKRRVGRRDRALEKEKKRANDAENDYWMAGQKKILRMMKERGLPITEYFDNPDVDITISDSEDAATDSPPPDPADQSEHDSVVSGVKD